MGNIIDRARYRGPIIPVKQVVPSPGEDRLRCGHCGGFDFEVHVSVKQDFGQIRGVVCRGCARPYPVNQQGVIEANGVHTEDAKDDYVRQVPGILGRGQHG